MEITIPKKLKKGDTVGLVTPAFAITKEQLQISIKNLQSIGFKTYHTSSVLLKHGYFAGTTQQRTDDIMQMFCNKNIDGIMCVRGGYGSSHIAPLLNYKLIKQNPKPFIGYSDITYLQNAILQKTGLVTFHGLSGVCDYNDFSISALQNVIGKHLSNYTFPYLREANTEKLSEFDLYTINEGTAKGMLVGGNLSVLVSMIGTPFAPNYENKIVFIEDIDERTYKIDRMLTQLLQASNIRKASGIVFGAFRACDDTKKPTFSLRQAIDNLIKPTKIPSSYGFSFGHIKNKITIPIGINAEFDANNNRLKIL